MKKITTTFGLALFSGAMLVTSAASAATYGGVEFPDGAVSFADAVVSYTQGTNVGSPYDDPTDALGTPDYSGSTGSVSLGGGGELILQFTDNSLTASGDTTDDLWVFEIGGAVETFFVDISTNLTDWISLGSLSGQPGGVDIDSFDGVEFGVLYSFVRLRDDPTSNQTGYPYGEADIDAVGAISSGAPVPQVPIPAAAFMFAPALLGFLGLRRKAKNTVT